MNRETITRNLDILPAGAIVESIMGNRYQKNILGTWDILADYEPDFGPAPSEWVRPTPESLAAAFEAARMDPEFIPYPCNACHEPIANRDDERRHTQAHLAAKGI